MKKTKYSALPDGKPKGNMKTLTIKGKARSVKEWIIGLNAGNLNRSINTYYDQIKEFNPDFEIKDVSRLTRIQKLEEYQRLTNYLNTQHVKSQSQTVSSD